MCCSNTLAYERVWDNQLFVYGLLRSESMWCNEPITLKHIKNTSPSACLHPQLESYSFRKEVYPDSPKENNVLFEH